MNTERRTILALYGRFGVAVLLMVTALSFYFGITSEEGISSDSTGAIMAGVFAGVSLMLIVSDLNKYILSSPVSRRYILSNLFAMVFVMMLLCIIISLAFNILGMLTAGNPIAINSDVMYARTLLAIWFMPVYGVMLYSFIRYDKKEAVVLTIMAMVLITALMLSVILAAGTLTGGDGTPGYLPLILVSAILTLWTYKLSQKAYMEKDF